MSSALAAAVDRLFDTLTRSQSLDEIQAAMADLLPHIQATPPVELNRQLARFLILLREATGPDFRLPVALAAMTCGAMVEHGGHPEVCGEALLDRMEDQLVALGVFWTEVRGRSGQDPTPATARRLGEHYLVDVYQTHPDAAMAYYSHNPLCLGLISHLATSPALRATARARPRLLELAPNLDVAINEFAHLATLLRVLDDEPLVVLYPAERKGFRVRITGVADVLQLDTLLAARLVGDPTDGWLPGEQPGPDVVAAVTDGPVRPDLTVNGVFDLWRWTGLRADGTLPGGPNDHRLEWNAIPADLPLFDGERVVLLSPKDPPADWPGTRRYRDLPGDLVLERMLSAGEVGDWLDRLAGARTRKPAGASVG